VAPSNDSDRRDRRPARSALASPWPFVGRSLELEDVTAAFDDATVAAVVVLGPAGVGKSRFAEECRKAAEQRGRSTYRVIGTLTASTVPLGALAHLAPRDLQLPDPRASGPLEIVDIVRAAIS
jgi:hypothetical protein